MTVEPLYEFGHGLSYTHYTYSNLRVDKTTFTKNDHVRVSVDVTNDGGYDGKEAVLWFVSDPVSSITRPIKELRHFEKQLIHRGETRTFTFDIDPLRDLSYRNGDGHQLLEAGTYEIMVDNQKIALTYQ